MPSGAVGPLKPHAAIVRQLDSSRDIPCEWAGFRKHLQIEMRERGPGSGACDTGRCGCKARGPSCADRPSHRQQAARLSGPSCTPGRLASGRAWNGVVRPCPPKRLDTNRQASRSRMGTEKHLDAVAITEPHLGTHGAYRRPEAMLRGEAPASARVAARTDQLGELLLRPGCGATASEIVGPRKGESLTFHQLRTHHPASRSAGPSPEQAEAAASTWLPCQPTCPDHQQPGQVGISSSAKPLLRPRQ